MKKYVVLLLLLCVMPLFAQNIERILTVDECIKLALNINNISHFYV